jgi:hypothetical protein
MSVLDLIRRAGVTLEVSSDTAGSPTGYVAFARPKNQITVQDQRGTTSITDFSTSATQISQQLTDGRNITISWSANLVIDDSGYATAKTGYRNDDTMYVQVTGVNTQGSPDTLTLEYRGFFSEFTHVFNESGAAEVNVSFVAADELTNAVT